MIKRFVPNTNYKSCVDAANQYVNNLNQSGQNYLYFKPYDLTPNNKQYYTNIYEALNLIEKMHIKPSGKVLEVGSGPGWVTEILASLGYKVCALEPCLDFIEISKKKLETFSTHLHHDIIRNVDFCISTLEESKLEENSFDAVLFISSLHHMVDENSCFSKCYKYLKSGGVLGIGEACYNPDMPQLMAECEEETRRCGVLESPFTQEYLDYLLSKHGFTNSVRYNNFNGLYPVSQKSIILPEGSNSNTVIAIKPYGNKTTLDYETHARASIAILNRKSDSNTATMDLRIKNTGESIWLSGSSTGKGYVTIALCEGDLGKDSFREALNRVNLPCDISPGEEFEIGAVFTMENPQDAKIDLINEGYYWFSAR